MSPICRDLAIVIPMYNEVESAASLLHEIAAALPTSLNCEIIVVDDGSTDGTYTELKALQTQISNLKIVRHLRNFGQSAALMTGVRAASHEWIVTLDGDGQNDPADIHKLLSSLEQYQRSQSIMIMGHRVTRKDTSVRKFSSRIANQIRGFLLQDNCPDTGCSLKLFRRTEFLDLPKFNHLHRFMPALFRRAGAEIVNVPVNHRPRLRGQSKYGITNRLWVGIVDLMGVMWLIRRPCCPESAE